MNRVLLIKIIFCLLILNSYAVIGQNGDTSGVTVEVDGNDPEIFTDLDFSSLDHIWESDKTPTPSQVVDIQVAITYIDNTSSEINCTFWHDDGTDEVSFLSQEFVYNSTQDRYNTTVGGYATGTTVKYYAECWDGGNPVTNRIRTPSITDTYSSLTWLSEGGSGVDLDSGFDFAPSILQYNDPAKLIEEKTMEYNLEVAGNLTHPYIFNLTEDIDFIYSITWTLHFTAEILDYYDNFGINSPLINGINIYYQQASLLKNQNITRNIDFSKQEFNAFAFDILRDDNDNRYLFAKWIYVGEGKAVDTYQDYQIYIQDNMTDLLTVTSWNATIDGYKVLGSNDGGADIQEVYGNNLEPDLVAQINEFSLVYGNQLLLGISTIGTGVLLWIIVKRSRLR